MKKTLIALAAVAATGAAFAQSSVTISGVVDVGIIDPIGAQKMRIDQSANGANQIVFSGAEDLGGGLRATFRLAQRFSPESGGNDGTANGRASFQGESTVGLAGGFGTVRLGRALTAFQGPINTTDPWGTLQQGSVAVLTTGYTTDFSTDAVRDSGGLGRTDAVFYSSPSFGGFSVAASYGFKQSAASGALVTTNPKDLISLWASYANGPILVAGGYERNRRDDDIWAILGTYDFGVVRIGAGWAQVDTAAVAGSKGKNWNLMATAPMGAATLKVGYGNTKAEGTGVKTTSKLGVGVDYALSKRTILYFSVGNNSKNTAGSDSGYDFGIRHTF